MEEQSVGRPRRQEVQAALIEAFVEEVRAAGYAATSLERVATRAGVAKATLYRRWASKGELAVAALEHLIHCPSVDTSPGPGSITGRISSLAQQLAQPSVRFVLLGAIGEAAGDERVRELLDARLCRPVVHELMSDCGVDEQAADLAFATTVGAVLHWVALTGEVRPDQVDGLASLIAPIVATTEAGTGASGA
jgi:AcrR family transcriptional regulator